MSMEASEYAVDDANENLLRSWLTAGKWERRQAKLLFLDIDPDREFGECFSTFSGHGEVHYEYDEFGNEVPDGVDENGELDYLGDEQRALTHKILDLYGPLEKILNFYDSAEPHEWIELAGEKGIAIPWLGWAIERGLYVQKQESVAALNVPEVEEPVTPWDLLADPATLISAFGLITGMNNAWFNNVNDTPKLKDALHTLGKGGRNGRKPYYYVFPVMQWLINPKRRKGNPMSVATGWRVLKNQFPAVYLAYQDQEPDAD
jgi:hypothetical protein